MGAVERARGFLALADALAAALPADRDGAHLAPRRSLAAQQVRLAPLSPAFLRFPSLFAPFRLADGANAASGPPLGRRARRGSCTRNQKPSQSPSQECPS